MKNRLKKFFKEKRKSCEPKLKALKKMLRISILKCFSKPVKLPSSVI